MYETKIEESNTKVTTIKNENRRLHEIVAELNEELDKNKTTFSTL